MLDLWDKFIDIRGAIPQIMEFIEQIAFWEHTSSFLTADESHWLHTAHMDMEFEETFPPIITSIVYV